MKSVGSGLTVLKFGGELIEDPDCLARLARAVARLSRRVPLVIVHGGGREIDLALARAGIATRQVDGLRITDAPTLQVVVGVLAGTVNTRLVAALASAGVRAVGLTAADAGVAPMRRAPAHLGTDGRRVDLGLVGRPAAARPPALLGLLAGAGYLPVVGSIGATRRGVLLNVNADTLAGSLAASLRARRLVVAGGTPGVLDQQGRTIGMLDARAVRRLIASGTASAGMVAKLRACGVALAGGVRDVVIADGRDARRLAALMTAGQMDRGAWTRMTA